MFTLAISCLTTFNLPWFMDLTFQVPMQYCSLQHRTLLLSQSHPQLGVFLFVCLFVCFCFGSISSFFLELFLHWFQYYMGHLLTWGVHLSVSSFCPFIVFKGVSRQEHWSGLPFPSPVGHILSELSTMTCLSWVTIHGMAHSFTDKLDKAVVQSKGRKFNILE